MLNKKKKEKEIELKTLKDVEIFSAGKWNGDNYSEEDLDEMATAYAETSELYRPFLKLGHGEEQKLLKQSELPAAGYMENVRRVGEKLIADFVDLPQKIYFLMKNKAYAKRSCEIFWDLSFNGKKYKRFLKGCALLGADMPAVQTLDDIINFYGLNEEKAMGDSTPNGILKICNYDEETENRRNTMEKELEKKTEDLSLEKEAMEKKYAEQEAKLEAAEKKYAEQEEKLQELLKKERESEIKLYVQDLEKENLITPAMKPLVELLAGDEQKEYSIQVCKKDEEATEKKFANKNEVLKEVLKLCSEASKVNLEEDSVDEVPVTVDKQDLLNDKIEKYSADHKVSYTEAYKAVMKNEEI